MSNKCQHSCYSCGKEILNTLSFDVVSFDSNNFAHWDCLKEKMHNSVIVADAAINKTLQQNS